jgi:hypothetical protein
MKTGNQKPKSAITRINQILKANGRAERLVRGRGYYYLFGGDAPGWQNDSIHWCWIEPKDFSLAMSVIADMFQSNHITLNTTEGRTK